MTVDKSICKSAGDAVMHVTEKVEERRDMTRADSVVRQPQVLAAYLQLLFNAILVLTTLFLLFQFILTVRSDVRHKLHLQMAANLSRTRKCKKDYEDNGCLPAVAVPALDGVCAQWLECMNQDSEDMHLYQSGKLWAQTVAEILNSFVEPISVRSLLVILTTVCAAVILTNAAFRFCRVYYF